MDHSGFGSIAPDRKRQFLAAATLPTEIPGKSLLGTFKARGDSNLGNMIMTNAIEQRTTLAEKIEFAIALFLGVMMGWAMLA